MELKTQTCMRAIIYNIGDVKEFQVIKSNQESMCV